MTNPELPTNNIPLDSEGALLTFIPELDALHIENLPGEPHEKTHYWSKSQAAELAGNRLAKIYLALGQGVHTIEDVKTKANISGLQVAAAAKQLSNILPAELFSYDPDENGNRLFNFGAFSIAFRKATEQEMAARVSIQTVMRQEAALLRKNEVLAAEAEKIDLTQKDHALIAISDRQFHLALDSAEAILAARTVQALNEMLEIEEPSVPDLTAVVWDSMPVAERQLYSTSEAKLYGASSIIADEIYRVVRNVIIPLGLIKRQQMQFFSIPQPANIAVQIVDEPPEEPYSSDHITPIFPPGTRKDLVRTNTIDSITSEELSGITEALEVAFTSSSLTQETAVNILDIIMDRRAKIIVKRLLAKRFGQDNVEKNLEKLDHQVRSSLGGAYFHAHRQRTIRGHVGGPGVQQVSGRLPDRTFNHIGTNVTTKWHIGTYTKSV